MRTLTAFLLLFLIATTSFGQLKYEKGYFINNDNQRIECLIKNMDWKNNPNHFSYKLDNSAASLKGDLNSSKEFGIYNVYKFVKADVKIDHSKTQAHSLSDNPEPLWWQEKLFLKVLVEGKAKLYCYESSNGKKFFYAVSDSAIKQLIHKEFLVGPVIAENNSFRDQLLMELRLPNTGVKNVDSISYTSESLIKYFKSYNGFKDDTSIELNHQIPRNYFNLKITTGINSSSVSMPIMENYPALAFSRNQSMLFGLEAEFILPFNMNKWSIVLNPTYQSFNSISTSGEAKLDYKSIEFPVGLRYYFYLDGHNKFYIDGFFVPQLSFDFDSKILMASNTSFDLAAANNVAFGGGFEHNRLSFETRYSANKNLLRKYGNFTADYSRISFILGYKIFTGKH